MQAEGEEEEDDYVRQKSRHRCGHLVVLFTRGRSLFLFHKSVKKQIVTSKKKKKLGEMKRGDKRHKTTSTFSTNRIYTPKGGNATRTGPATLYISDD